MTTPPPARPAVFRALWPILEPRPLAVHVAEARPELRGLMARARVEAVGRVRWTIRPGAEVPGSGGAAEVLLADVPARAVPRTADQQAA